MSGQLRSSRRRKNTISSGLKDRIMGKRSGQEENVIPMINIIFLLLLYFMIVGNLQPDYDIVPPASTRQAVPSAEVPTVAVDQDGSLRFEPCLHRPRDNQKGDREATGIGHASVVANFATEQ